MSADLIFEKCTVWIQIRTEHALEELSLLDGSFDCPKRMLKRWIKYSQYYAGFFPYYLDLEIEWRY